jgi:hypothetical protein
MELEVGAVAKRFEPEYLKPLQFKQRELLGKNSCQLSVACCQFVLPSDLFTTSVPSAPKRRLLAPFPSWAGSGWHKLALL